MLLLLLPLLCVYCTDEETEAQEGSGSFIVRKSDLGSMSLVNGQALIHCAVLPAENKQGHLVISDRGRSYGKAEAGRQDHGLGAVLEGVVREGFPEDSVPAES